MSNTEITLKVNELVELESFIDELKAEAESLKDEIKAVYISSFKQI